MENFFFVLLIVSLSAVCVCETNNKKLSSICSEEKSYACRCIAFTSEVTDLYAIDVICTYRNITTLTSKHYVPEYTEILDFSNNKISTIKADNNLNAPTMIKLSLKRNNLRKIEDNAFVGLPKLKQLDLSENSLSDLSPGVFHGIFKLQVLSLASNRLKSFEQYTFHPLPQLEILILNDNDLGEFFSGIADIFASSGLSLNPKITALHMDNLNITNLPSTFFYPAYNLRHISLAGNHINYIPLFPFTIEYLELSSNDIFSITATDTNFFPGLKTLILNNLQSLKAINAYTFQPLRGLNRLELENCKNLRSFSVAAFGNNLVNGELEVEDFPVTSISFRGSGLRTLDERWLPLFSRLHSLDLRGNPWECDCRIAWFLKLQLDEKHKEFISCWSNSESRSRQLWSLKPRELACPTWRGTVFSMTRAAIIVLCLVLAGLVIWLVVIWKPEVYARYSTLQINPNRAEAY